MRNIGNSRTYILILTRRKNNLKERVNITRTLHRKHSNFSPLKEFLVSEYFLEYAVY